MFLSLLLKVYVLLETLEALGRLQSAGSTVKKTKQKKTLWTSAIIQYRQWVPAVCCTGPLKHLCGCQWGSVLVHSRLTDASFLNLLPSPLFFLVTSTLVCACVCVYASVCVLYMTCIHILWCVLFGINPFLCQGLFPFLLAVRRRNNITLPVWLFCVSSPPSPFITTVDVFSWETITLFFFLNHLHPCYRNAPLTCD